MENYQVLGIRTKETEKDFRKLMDEGCIEALEIAHGYFNPLIVSNVLLCKIKCLKDKMGV